MRKRASRSTLRAPSASFGSAGKVGSDFRRSGRQDSPVPSTTAYDVTVIDHPLVRVKLSQLRAAETGLAAFREEMTGAGHADDLRSDPQPADAGVHHPDSARGIRRQPPRPPHRARADPARGTRHAGGDDEDSLGSSIAHIGLFRN
jgi:hypothetical protein